jgi:toxin ParE1/3/4
VAAKPLEIHPAALEEFKSALTWYLERSESSAGRFVAEVDRAIDFVIKSPGRWPSGEHATRKFVLQRFPFAIIYREKETVVQVLAVAHGHRRPGYWKNRL